MTLRSERPIEVACKEVYFFRRSLDFGRKNRWIFGEDLFFGDRLIFQQHFLRLFWTLQNHNSVTFELARGPCSALGAPAQEGLSSEELSLALDFSRVFLALASSLVSSTPPLPMCKLKTLINVELKAYWLIIPPMLRSGCSVSTNTFNYQQKRPWWLRALLIFATKLILNNFEINLVANMHVGLPHLCCPKRG